MRRLSTQQIILSGIAVICGITVFAGIALNTEKLRELTSSVASYRNATLIISPMPTTTVAPTDTPVPSLKKTAAQEAKQDSKPWGVAEKVDDVTYTIKVGNDASMTTSQELLDALNNYRAVNGKQALSWDEKLGTYAQTRAQKFKDIGGTDKHDGFNSFLNNENGFQQLGYNRLGENSYFGGPLSGTHLIEWVFAQSPGHNANQLDGQWTHVGIGVTDTSVNLNFGGNN